MKLFKFFILFTVGILTIYPQAELTRYIIINNTWIGAENVADNWAEIGFMWFGWLFAMIFLNWIIGKILNKQESE
jgi:hypothetical protein